MTTEYYTVAQVAKKLQVQRATVYRLIDSGRLQAVKLSGKLLRIPAQAIDQYAVLKVNMTCEELWKAIELMLAELQARLKNKDVTQALLQSVAITLANAAEASNDEESEE